MTTIDTILSSVSISALFTVLVFITKNWFTERLKNSIAHEYAVMLETHRTELAKAQAESLERLKDELATRQAVQAAALASLTSAHTAVHDRTLRAIETIWSETLRIRENTALYAGYSDILRATEIPDAFANNPNFRELIEGVDEVKEAEKFFGNAEEIERSRPFCGEYLFSLFFAYRAFTGRVAHLLLRSYVKGAAKSWHGDPGINQLLATVLTSDELAQVQALPALRLRTVQQLVERKMLDHIARVLSGEITSASNLQQAHRIAEAARTLTAAAPN